MRPHPALRRLGAAALFCCVLPLAADDAASEADAGDAGAPLPAPDAPAAEFLRFTEDFDGRCYNLSEGGKLTSMTNVHPSKPIRYRMVRVFADAPQPGRATGVIAPGDEPIKLGCNQVDKRRQYWRIETAEFEP